MMNRSAYRRPGRWPALLALATVLSGCDSLLEVENPNNVKEEDLGNPAAATAIANGAHAAVSRVWSWIQLDHGAASDELTWVGSRDAYLQLDVGDVTDPNNEFSDATFPYVAEGRWTADQAIDRLEAFDQAGTLTDRANLARAYLYGAIIYTAIADHFDDFVISDRSEASPPIGEANMVGLYDTAIGYLDKALPIAQAEAESDLELSIIAQRARAKFQKAMWAKVNPRGTIAADPLVDDAAAEADATLFLTAAGAANDWRYRFTYGATTVGSNLGSWVNSRTEFRVGNPYVVPTANDKRVESVKLMDLIDDVVHPRAAADITEFAAGGNYPTATVLSAREIHLILAEIELARNPNSAAAVTHLNHVRDLDGLTAYDPAVHTTIAPVEMLQFLRQANLFLQNRRLMDHYRFGNNSVDWTPTSEAVQAPGSFFPITRIEREANCHIVGSC